MEGIELSLVLTIVHLFGVALGAGSAFLSDGMFFKSIKDQKINLTEVGFLKLGSSIVWIGLILLVVSGIGLFLQDPSGYLASSKFLAKMTIIAALIINGLIFHTTHVPRIMRHVDHHLPSSDEFMRKRMFLLASGAISVTSWVSAIILGALSHVPYSYTTIMLVYGTVLFFAVAVAYVFKEYIIPTYKKPLS
jgi:hypothetical protein